MTLCTSDVGDAFTLSALRLRCRNEKSHIFFRIRWCTHKAKVQTYQRGMFGCHPSSSLRQLVSNWKNDFHNTLALPSVDRHLPTETRKNEPETFKSKLIMHFPNQKCDSWYRPGCPSNIDRISSHSIMYEILYCHARRSQWSPFVCMKRIYFFPIYLIDILIRTVFSIHLFSLKILFYFFLVSLIAFIDCGALCVCRKLYENSQQIYNNNSVHVGALRRLGDCMNKISVNNYLTSKKNNGKCNSVVAAICILWCQPITIIRNKMHAPHTEQHQLQYNHILCALAER